MVSDFNFIFNWLIFIDADHRGVQYFQINSFVFDGLLFCECKINRIPFHLLIGIILKIYLQIIHLFQQWRFFIG